MDGFQIDGRQIAVIFIGDKLQEKADIALVGSSGVF